MSKQSKQSKLALVVIGLMLFFTAVFVHCQYKVIEAKFINRSGSELTMSVDGVAICPAQPGGECIAVIEPGTHTIVAEFRGRAILSTQRTVTRMKNFDYAVCRQDDQDKACHD